MASKPSVLLVDDDPSIRESMEAILTLQGYEVGLAASGQEAIALFAQRVYDLVLLDILMPGMNGIETLQHIKEQRPEVRVIMITGMEGNLETRRAMELGAEALFRKPLDVATFLPVLLPIEEQG